MAVEFKEKVKIINDSIDWWDVQDIDTKVFREYLKTLEQKFNLKVKHRTEFKEIVTKIAMYENRDYVNFADIFFLMSIECCCTPTAIQVKETMFDIIFVRISTTFRDIKLFLEKNSKVDDEEKVKQHLQQIDDFIADLNDEFKKQSRKALILNNQLFRTTLFEQEVNDFLDWSEEKITTNIINSFKSLEELKRKIKI